MSSSTLRGQSTWRTLADSRLRAADRELSPSHSCALADGVSRRPYSCHLADPTVSGPVRSVRRRGLCSVGELGNGGGDPAPGVGGVVIAIAGELVGTRRTLLKRFVAAALQHQGGGAPDIKLGYHAAKIPRLWLGNV